MSEHIIETEMFGDTAFVTIPPKEPKEEIVRCRDCEYFEQDYTDGVMFDETVCWAWDNGHDYPSYTNPDGFCYLGKRRESE